MAHQFESGFFLQEPAWHRLGKTLKQPPNTSTAIVEAGLDWRVLEQPLPHQVGQKQLVRDRDQRLLATVPLDYVPLQNLEAFQWFDPFLEHQQLQLEAAGSLCQGQQIWIIAKLLNHDATVRHQDLVSPYLLLHNSHDGNPFAWVQFTPIRVVCMNTLAIAVHSRQQQVHHKTALSIAHNANLREQMQQVGRLIDWSRRQFDVAVADYQAMAQFEMNHKAVQGYFDRLFGVRSRAMLMENYLAGRGNQGVSLWDAYNAVTEWTAYQAPGTPEQRLLNNWFGHGRQLCAQAHDLALELLRNPMERLQPTPKQSRRSLELVGSR